MKKWMMPAAAVLFFPMAPARAQSGNTGGTGTSTPAATKHGGDKNDSDPGKANKDSNTSSHSGSDAKMSRDPSKDTVKAASGEVGSAKKNKRHHGSYDTRKNADSVKKSDKSNTAK
jgi:hypothetical protein